MNVVAENELNLQVWKRQQKKKKNAKKAEKAKASSSITVEKKGKKYTADTVSAEEIMKRRNTAYKFLV